ncbi:MAG: Protoporphyrinogen oxidase [Pseudomonadota bacterium]
MRAHADVVVVGAGIAGLAAAHRLAAAGRDVLVLEASDRAGGKIGSVRSDDGFLCELGPNSFLGSARHLWGLVDALGLDSALVPGLPPGHRWIHRDGKTRQLPSGPLSALGGDWLPWSARLRVAREVFVPPAPRQDETLWDFVARRCGAGFADAVIAPFTGGVYAGDPHQLGAYDAFPKMWRLEAEGGGLIRGAFAMRKQRAAERGVGAGRKGLWNFADGLEVLPRALATALGERLRLGVNVHALAQDGGGVVLELQGPDGSETLRAAAVVLATPLDQTAALLRTPAPAAAEALGETPVAPVAVVHLGGPDPDGAAPPGFGALVARGESVRALGVLVPSSLFAGRAPDGAALYAVFLGGVTDPEVVELDDDALVELALQGRRDVFGAAVDTTPTLRRVTRWRAAIPQYVVGHRARVAQARQALASALPGVWIAGAACDGVSIDDAAGSGLHIADALLAAAAEAAA